LRWGTRKADTAGLPIYLESSPEGHRLYLKHGFENVEIFHLDLGALGGEAMIHESPLMIRKPNALPN
jgi:hypothetical protein